MMLPPDKIKLEHFNRFFRNVEITDTCWLWTGCKSDRGYGKIMLNYKHMTAHRVSCWWFVAPIDGPLMVRHTCDNPSCVNPFHLELGTHQDNMDDCVERMRRPKAENHYKSQLTAKQVLEIRDLYANKRFTQHELAALYGVGRMTICHIVLRNSWKDI